MKAKYGVVLNGSIDVNLNDFDIDIWIAVDGGINHLLNCSIIADYYLGDMDSSSDYTNYKNIIQYSPEKDETDFLLALNIIKEEDTIVFGFFKNIRLEHFYANLKMIKSNMTYVYNFGIIKLYKKGDYLLSDSKRYDYISFFAKSSQATITIKGAKYSVENYNLTCDDITCISNEFINNQMNLIVKKGEILTFFSKKD